MRRSFLCLDHGAPGVLRWGAFVMLLFWLAVPAHLAHADSLSARSVQLADLRPGYTTLYARYRSPAQVVAGRSLVPRDLGTHGWMAHYEAYYQRGANSPLGVGDALDQFRAWQSAHWFLAFRLSHLAPGFVTTALPRVGDESTGIIDGTYLGIILRQGSYVADVFVTLQVPDPRDSVLALAELVDQRLRGGTAHAPFTSHGGALVVHAWVSPSSMPYDAYPTLYARTTPGATCSADVIYTTNRHPVSFDGSPQRVGSQGVVGWGWHEETVGSGGTAYVSCQLGGRQASTTTAFSVD